MASLKSIKKRIGSVRNTQKITKAMKMVAAAKLRRAQNAAVNARHYTNAVRGLVHRIVLANRDLDHPLMRPSEKAARREYLVFTSDRGLCGGFNGNLLRKLGSTLETSRQEGLKGQCRVIGKKGKDYFKAKNWELAESVTGLYDSLNRGMAEDLAQIAVHRFEAGKTDEVYLVYNYFKSAMVQEVVFQKILPLSVEGAKERPIDYIYEPSAEVVLDKLLNESLVALIYQAFLESMASELAARMTAMDNATNNASDMIGYLTLQYNRARKASITKDLMDIVNGAEALR